MDAYIYRAALYCEDCANTIKDKLRPPDCECGATRSEHSAADDICPQGGVTNFPRHGQRYEAQDVDSGEWPAGPYADGGGEADSPQHCDSCLEFLENPLTEDGIAYVLEALAGNGDVTVLVTWEDFYADIWRT